MRNHHEKAQDMSESVLPSTGSAGVVKARRVIRHSERARARAALSQYLADPGRGDEQADAHVAGRRYHTDTSDLVWGRRAKDKVGPLCRWVVRRVATNPELADLEVADQVEAFRHVLPDNLIGRHALSHIETTLERNCTALDRARRPASPSYRETEAALLRDQLRLVLDSGRHSRFNRAIKAAQAGSERPVRVLLGAHDLDAFTEYAFRRSAFQKAIARAAVDAEAR